MAGTCKKHRDTSGAGGSNNFFIANAATGLHNRCDTSIDQNL
jgi:hypothetical protein